LKQYSRLVAVEEHLAAGGLASLLREQLAQRVHSLAVPPKTLGLVGSQEYLRRHAGLDAAGLVAFVKALP
jgi:transketolase C-terminal domain/subunit